MQQTQYQSKSSINMLAIKKIKFLNITTSELVCVFYFFFLACVIFFKGVIPLTKLCIC